MFFYFNPLLATDYRGPAAEGYLMLKSKILVLWELESFARLTKDKIIQQLYDQKIESKNSFQRSGIFELFHKLTKASHAVRILFRSGKKFNINTSKSLMNTLQIPREYAPQRKLYYKKITIPPRRRKKRPDRKVITIPQNDSSSDESSEDSTSDCPGQMGENQSSVKENHSDIVTRNRCIGLRGNTLLIDDINNVPQKKVTRRRLMHKEDFFPSPEQKLETADFDIHSNNIQQMQTQSLWKSINDNSETLGKKRKITSENIHIQTNSKKRAKPNSSNTNVVQDVDMDVSTPPGRGRPVRYSQNQNFDRSKLDKLKPILDIEKTMEVNFIKPDELMKSYWEGNTDYIGLGSVMMKTTKILTEYAKQNDIPQKSCPENDQYQMNRFQYRLCARNMKTVGMNFIDFARYANFIVKMGHLLTKEKTYLQDTQNPNLKIRSHINIFRRKMDTFLKVFDIIKCPYRFLEEIKRVATIQSYNIDDLIIKGTLPSAHEVLQSSIGQIGILPVEDQIYLEHLIHRKLKNNRDWGSYRFNGGSILQYYDCFDIPLFNKEKTWTMSNPIWVKFYTLLSEHLLSLSEKKIGGIEVNFTKDIENMDDNYVRDPNTMIPGEVQIKTQNVPNRPIDDLIIVTTYSASKHINNQNVPKQLRLQLIDSNSWKNSKEIDFMPCKEFFKKIEARTLQDNQYLRFNFEKIHQNIRLIKDKINGKETKETTRRRDTPIRRYKYATARHSNSSCKCKKHLPDNYNELREQITLSINRLKSTWGMKLMQLMQMHPSSLSKQQKNEIYKIWKHHIQAKPAYLYPKAYNGKDFKIVKEKDGSLTVPTLPPSWNYAQVFTTLLNYHNCENVLTYQSQIYDTLDEYWLRNCKRMLRKQCPLISLDSTLSQIVRLTLSQYNHGENFLFSRYCRLGRIPRITKLFGKDYFSEWPCINPTFLLVKGAESILRDPEKYKLWMILTMVHMIIPDQIHRAWDTQKLLTGPKFVKVLKDIVPYKSVFIYLFPSY